MYIAAASKTHFTCTKLSAAKYYSANIYFKRQTFKTFKKKANTFQQDRFVETAFKPIRQMAPLLLR